MKTLRTPLFVLSLLFLLVSTAVPVVANAFAVDDRVQVTDGPLNVRSAPNLSGAVLGSQAQDNQGTIVGGPVSADGYTWWNINYDTGADGWSADAFLTKISNPEAVTIAASNITSTSARLNGRVNPDGNPANAYFAWGKTTNTLVLTPFTPLGSGTSFVNHSRDITGLEPNTTYMYRIVGYNTSGETIGVSFGDFLTFRTQSVTSNPQCSDGVDNDGDGLVDFPADPGCSNSLDDTEYNSSITYVCSDGVDNDGDGLTDFPNDPGCSSPTDTNEYNAPQVYACSDGIDNDRDGFIDYPSDPGCVSPTDPDEYNAPPQQYGTLTPQIEVINDNGGTLSIEDFSPQIYVSATGTVIDLYDDETIELVVGQYSVSTGLVAGYTPSFGAGCDFFGQFTISNGEDTVCRITYDDHSGSTDAPTCDLFTASPQIVALGQSSTLTWESTGATNVSINGEGSLPSSGSMTVSPTELTTYTAVFSNAGGETECSTFVQVGGGPVEPGGCTDPSASNFDPNAEVDDGSCVYDDTSQEVDLEVTLAKSVVGDEARPTEVPLGVLVKNLGPGTANGFVARFYFDGELVRTFEYNGSLTPGVLEDFISGQIEPFHVTDSDNKVLSVEVTPLDAVDTDVSNNEDELVLHMYAVDFRLDADAFSFPNWDYREEGAFNAVIDEFTAYASANVDESDYSLTTIAKLLVSPSLTLLSSTAGHCYGMAVTSIDWFWNPDLRRDVAPGSQNTYDVERQQAEAVIIENQWNQLLHMLPFADEVSAAVLSMNVSAELDKIRDTLKQGDPVILYMKDTETLYGFGGGNHVVVGYKLVQVEPDTYRLYLYDNNYPYGESLESYYIDFNPEENTASYPQNTSVTKFSVIPHWHASGEKSAGKLVEDALNSYTSSLFGLDLMSITSRSPVLPLVQSESGARFGYVGDGFVNEIEGAQLLKFGDAHTILLPTGDYVVHLVGTSSGKVGIDIVKPLTESRFSFSTYDNIPIKKDEVIEVQVSDVVIPSDVSLHGEPILPVEERAYDVNNETDDITAPETHAYLEGAQLHGVYIGNVELSLSASDDADDPGVKRAEYSLDGESWEEYVEPLTLSEESEYTIYYRSTDWFGNVEEVKSVSFEIVSAQGVIEETLSWATESGAHKNVLNMLENALKPQFWSDRNTVVGDGVESVPDLITNAVRFIEKTDPDRADRLGLVLEILSR